MSDFFESNIGSVSRGGRHRSRLMGRIRDLFYDAVMIASGGRRRAAAIAAATPVRKVLALGVSHPDRPGELARVMDRLRESRHEVTVSTVEMQPGMGKFQNVGRALAQVERPLAEFDWIVITDDDVTVPAGFLDRFVGLAEQAGLMLAQPAHRFYSYTTYALTQRRWGSLARVTRWVEIGPVTAFRRDALADLVPFPVQRWDWGLDIYWAQLALRKGWRVGVVDGAALAHNRPVAGGYDAQAAIAEAVEFMALHQVTLTRAETQSGDRVVTSWWPDVAPAVQPGSGQVVHSSGGPDN